MWTETTASLRKKLPPGLFESLEAGDDTPLQRWIDGDASDSIALMRHASTFDPEQAFAVVVAAAAASLLDAAAEERPLDLSYAIPLWRSITEGKISVQFLDNAARDLFEGDTPSPARTIAQFDEYIALGLARTNALDHAYRRRLLERALDPEVGTLSSLGFFSYDLEIAAPETMDEQTQRFPARWAETYPEDPDAPIMRLRAYLQGARRLGVLGALTPLEQNPDETLRIADAAWTIAWDEAARVGNHGTCAELALRRANAMPPRSISRYRWLLIHGLHEEHIPVRHVEGLPVSRALLDMMYEFEKPFVPAVLCVSIAARTNRLAPVLRETLPYLPGPTHPLLTAAFGVGEAPESLMRIAEINTAGVLLALRMKREEERRIAQGLPSKRGRATPAPTSILDDYENNEDLLAGGFDFEREATQPHDTLLRTESTSHIKTPTDALASNTLRSEPTPAPDTGAPHHGLEDRGADYILWADAWDEELPTGVRSEASIPPANSVPDAAPAHAQTPPNGSNTPSALDVALAATLPDELRGRADALLAARLRLVDYLPPEVFQELDGNLPSLPEAAWVGAEQLERRGDLPRAVAWKERIARATSDRLTRAHRYRVLGSMWLDRFREPAQALEYLIVAFTCDPTDDSTLQLLDTSYRALDRPRDLLVAYRTAIDAAKQSSPPVDGAIIARWEARLRGLEGA